MFTCWHCGGELLRLGSLGKTFHYRCRQCGAEDYEDASHEELRDADEEMIADFVDYWEEE